MTSGICITYPSILASGCGASKGLKSRYYRAIGSAEALLLKAADLGQRWMKGVSGEFALKKLREQPLTW